MFVMAGKSLCGKVDTKILSVEIVDVRLSVADLLKIIFVIIVTKLLNFVLMRRITSMITGIIERTSFYLLEKVTFLSQ